MLLVLVCWGEGWENLWLPLELTAALSSSPGFFMRRNQAHQLRRMTRTWTKTPGQDTEDSVTSELGSGNRLQEERR